MSYGPIDKSDALKYGIVTPEGNTVRLAKSTEYIKLPSSEGQTIGVSHHRTGLGKLKIYDDAENSEYGISISDILNKPLKDWKIDKK